MLYLYKPYIPKEAYKEIESSLENKNLIYGKYCKEFEKSFSKYLKVNFSLAVSSGTAALHLALLALELKKGDLVFVPDFTWPATINVIEMVGATPVFIDVNPSNYCMDIKLLEKSLENSNNNNCKKVIMPVHQFGFPIDMITINEIADKYNCKVVEDAACAVGSEFNDQKVGSFSDVSCFSFHPRKILTTGEGGMICTNDLELANKIRYLLNHGFSADMKSFNFPGLNYRLTELQAILGIYGIPSLSERIERRKKLKEIYFSKLSNISEITLPENHWQSFMVVLDKKIDRDNFLKQMNQKNINAIIGSRSVISLNYYKNKYNSGPLMKNSNYLDKHGVALPFCDEYGEKEVLKVVKTIKSIFK